ncbi:SDR family NAD(P)-dependent oxidoreductase [uncultured Thermanaerothrix sp.]|uniref:SDR family NAD(P)-dependent oxidoreductase n=1 Tax=uncultured Thermanaerothrix sp. TaxID=1195149 RepID=UPI0026233C97|nr:SDR family NAD(P)-dependent oxidoreductase [uncultured Thermanaerothrix sp.]
MTDARHPLVGKVILVSGAARGLGRVLALALAQAGAALALHDLAPTHLEETCQQVQALGAPVKLYIADSGKGLPARMLITEVLEDWGRLDGLINNLHVHPEANLLNLDEWDWERTLEINLSGPFLLMQSAISPMVAAGGGVILNLVAEIIPSETGRINAAFAASQFGLAGLTQATAYELLSYNIFSCALEVAPLVEILDEAFWLDGEGQKRITWMVRWMARQAEVTAGSWIRRVAFEDLVRGV